jgi:hypothetical protein
MTSNTIESLEDEKAYAILARIAESHMRATDQPVTLSADVRQALANAFATSAELSPVSEGELARQALLVLAEDERMRETIDMMAVNLPEPSTQYDAGLTVAMTAAVLFALQTHIQLERDKQGHWSVKVEKKPTSEALLKKLVQKLLAYVPGSGC